MILFILATIIIVLLVAAYVAIKTALDFIHRPKPVTLDTKLEIFQESQTMDNKVKNKGQELNKSATLIFEDKCVRNPVESDDLEEIVNIYRGYLTGEALDPEAKHAPSEFLEGTRNPDYKLYLLNQSKALKKRGYDTTWISGELKRINEALEYEDIKIGFIETLVRTYRFPAELVPYAVTDERMESFSEKEWKKLSQVVRNYLSDFSEEAVGDFLMTIDDYDKLTDYNSMERYAVWHEHGVPMTVSKDNILGNISDDFLMEVVRYMDEESYDWKEALEKVLQDSINIMKNEELRKVYRALLERS